MVLVSQTKKEGALLTAERVAVDYLQHAAAAAALARRRLGRVAVAIAVTAVTAAAAPPLARLDLGREQPGHRGGDRRARARGELGHLFDAEDGAAGRDKQRHRGGEVAAAAADVERARALFCFSGRVFRLRVLFWSQGVKESRGETRRTAPFTSSTPPPASSTKPIAPHRHEARLEQLEADRVHVRRRDRLTVADRQGRVLVRLGAGRIVGVDKLLAVDGACNCIERRKGGAVRCSYTQREKGGGGT